MVVTTGAGSENLVMVLHVIGAVSVTNDADIVVVAKAVVRTGFEKGKFVRLFSPAVCEVGTPG